MNETAERARQVTEVPLLRFLGATLAGDEDARSLVLDWHPNVLNAADALHGGVIATVLDLAAYLAVLPALSGDEEAVTHGFTASYLAVASPGESLRACGTVLRRSRRLAFLQSELRSDDALLAVATVTKSIVPR